MGVKNFGSTSLDEIKERLEVHNLSLRNWANPRLAQTHFGSDDAFMNEGQLSYCCTAALVVCFLCLDCCGSVLSSLHPSGRLAFLKEVWPQSLKSKFVFLILPSSVAVGAPSPSPASRKPYAGELTVSAPQQKVAPLGYCSGVQRYWPARSTVLNLTSSGPMTIRKKFFQPQPSR